MSALSSKVIHRRQELTLGLFLLVINTFLLWLTDQLFDDFEIEDMGTTFIAAVLITIADSLLGWIL